ncbi:MAG: DUF2973 domain-containing protein [Leptolyngbyaceae cyanobacterium MO_188.B28]|nr:DUF2973 domain-containing protein [Leptolyngbyaceae cyanobacterium MO_188.B28]
MLHLLYIVVFTILAVLAIGNLIRNLISLGSESQKNFSSAPYGAGARPQPHNRPTPHPELLDDEGNVINEPLLVMRSISIRDAREQLDALYESSAGQGDEASEEKQN